MLIVQIALGIVLGFLVIKYHKVILQIVALVIIIGFVPLLAWIGFLEYFPFMEYISGKVNSENLKIIKDNAYIIFILVAFVAVYITRIAFSFVWKNITFKLQVFLMRCFAHLFYTAVAIICAGISWFLGSVAVEMYYYAEIGFLRWLLFAAVIIGFLVSSIFSIAFACSEYQLWKDPGSLSL